MARVIDAVIRLRDQFSATLRNVNGNLSQFQRQASYAGRSMVSVGKDMEKVGKNISTKVSLPIIGLGIAASEAATKFKHEMADIRKEVEARGLPESQVNALMKDMSDKSLKWSEDFGQSTESINEGLLVLVKDGYQADEAMSIMNTSLLTARGANEQLSTVVDQLGSSLEAYGMKTNNSAQTTKNMAHMADTFAYIANHTKASITSLGEAFSVAGSTANAMHQPMAQTAAAIGILESNGVDANTAATALKAGLVNLTKPTIKMQKALNQMGFSAFDSKGHMKDLSTILNEVEKKTEGWTDQQKQAAIATIFGKDSLSSWNILLHKGGGFLADLANSANGATGEVQRLSDAMKNTEENKFKELTQSVHALGIAFGKDILPSIIPIVNKITDLVKSFANLDDGTKQAIIKFAMIAAAVGPPILILGKLTHGIGETIQSFTRLTHSISDAGGILKYLATPGGMVIVVITAVALAAFLLIKYWGPISTFFKKLWADIQAAFTGIKAVVVGAWTAVVNATLSAWNGIVNGVKTFINWIANAVLGLAKAIVNHFKQQINDLRSIFNSYVAIFKSYWDIIKNVFLGAVLLIIDLVTGNFGKLKEDAGKIFKNISADLSNIWENIKSIFAHALDAVGATFAQAWAGIKTLAINTWNGVVAWFETLPGRFLNAASNIGTSIISGITTALTWIENLPAKMLEYGKDMIQGLINGIKGAIGGIGDAVNSVADKIRSYLHFSVPDVGPLTDYETWMPDFMKGMSQGIKVNAHLVTDKVKDVALGIKSNMQQGTLSGSGTTGSPLGNAVINNYFTLNGVVRDDSDIDKIADALVLKINAAAINMA
ncbi:phage tail tape measure protein, TP901 family [Desulfosporosinus acidiphilus SJ4]|uniref:Phage tail tape measure protein, TP901 family n=1 Tax=Desulfosporosinus acidiphilus (strain DSM 22704 / JCM 16185 / SJ4) TaxID=646529 RepID=I4D815_DESAJ|nr:phage tail tape measure protein [Desulfosporosinus acidiphilus]AFM41939.1 phage tail tape measure protein, TP901 family [Desulfosporosinus acidiphilus SJ4]